MSDLGDTGTELGSGTVGGLLSSFVDQGLSANQALSALRAAGGAMGRTPFLRLYGQVRAAIGNRPAMAGLDYGAAPGADVFTPWAAGEPGRYATVVQTFVRRPGSPEWEPRFTTVVTADPHSPQFAVDQARDELEAGAGPGGPYGDEIVGAGVVTSMNVTVAKGA